MRLWRQTEEMEGLLGVWMRRLTNSAGNSTSGITSRPEGVQSWKSRHMLSSSACDRDERDASVTVRPMVSRYEVLLERLPYLSRISNNVTETEELQKLTQFHGIGEQSQDLPDEDLDNPEEHSVEFWATDGSRSSPQKRSRRANQLKSLSNILGPSVALPVEEAVDKLILSDDDIEDD